jgi:hypothetical protein
VAHVLRWRTASVLVGMATLTNTSFGQLALPTEEAHHVELSVSGSLDEMTSEEIT